MSEGKHFKKTKYVFLNVWLGWQDLNLRMRESKSRALPLGDTPTSGEAVQNKNKWGGRQVSNLLPPEPQSGALPIELRPPYILCAERITLQALRATRLYGVGETLFPVAALFGAPGETRTPDTRLRRPLLYPAELRAHKT